MSAPIKIMVVGGLHGDERLGIQLVNQLRQQPIPGIEAIFGNPMAAAVQARYIDKDLNRVFPGKLDGCLEEVRAHQIMQVVQEYDFVLDFHNTVSHENDCGFVGKFHLENTLKLGLALGLDRVIVATYDCINKFLPNCLSVEVSNSSEFNHADYWYEKLLTLSQDDLMINHLQNQNLETLQLFEFRDRVSADQYKRFGFNFQNFTAISKEAKQQLNLATDADVYAILVDPSLVAGRYCVLVERLPISGFKYQRTD